MLVEHAKNDTCSTSYCILECVDIDFQWVDLFRYHKNMIYLITAHIQLHYLASIHSHSEKNHFRTRADNEKSQIIAIELLCMFIYLHRHYIQWRIQVFYAVTRWYTNTWKMVISKIAGNDFGIRIVDGSHCWNCIKMDVVKRDKKNHKNARIRNKP